MVSLCFDGATFAVAGVAFFCLPGFNGSSILKRKILLALGAALLLLAAAFSRPTYRYPSSTELHRKAHYLERIISTPENETPELRALDNAEWSLFSMSFSTYAFANMAQLDGSFRPEAKNYSALAIKRMLTGRIAQAFRNPDAAVTAAEEPRGSHLGWSIFFLSRFAPAYAAAQYRGYQQHFSTNFGVIRLYRERIGSYTTSAGDVDSGPLVLGYSIPANAFAFGNAVALRDGRNAQRLRRVISFGSREVITPTEIRYGVRFVDLSVSPLAEALLLHAETMTPWRVYPLH